MIPPNILIDTVKKMRGEKEFRLEISTEDSKIRTFIVWFLLIFCIICIIGVVGVMIYTFLHRHTGF